MEYCPECKSHHINTDLELGYYVCEECGYDEELPDYYNAPDYYDIKNDL